ncbi:16S rRNA (uracil(1498)-N(3))-methyltransferase [Kineobactrum sediminis]|uniref:Ribosomal RNA small subunit methyltransferase E n=1 Tax=Kineobactrum sediminis TaxID=1905677 RepID=A0A2N5Y0P0_9GAMM|nr:16S rRNA (uracil(1498)-N(3))-methyltransferase [Kineobactrum sediminis]PLW81958.1 16S rRNA (uracil(1498)-N(3))-methyltransferase [Kineobactrum sediminis]
MNLLLFSAGECDTEGQLHLSGRRAQHVCQVLKARAGDQLVVGEINGLMGHAQVVAIEPQYVQLSVTLDQRPPAKLPVSLVVALPRPKMLRRILRAAAEFGVDNIHLINSYRVEKSYWQTPVLAPDTVRDYLLQGLEQARDTMLPGVHVHKRFKPFVEDDLPALMADREALLAHPGNVPVAPAEPTRRRLLVIGPEGGFIPYEVEKLLAAGCRQVSLGTRILRVENAVAALLGRAL